MRNTILPIAMPWIRLTFACAAIAAGVGCQARYVALSDQEVANHRARLVLAEEPAGAIAVLGVHELLAGPAEDPHEHADHDHADHDGHVHSHDAEVHTASIEPQDVVVIGQIGGMPSPWGDTYPDYPWKEREAAFFLADPATVAELADHVHSHEHSHDDCPFCAREAAANMKSVAVVNFSNESGGTLPVDARRLFELEPNSSVVVRGKARLVGGKLLVIDADGIYVRR